MVQTNPSSASQTVVLGAMGTFVQATIALETFLERVRPTIIHNISLEAVQWNMGTRITVKHEGTSTQDHAYRGVVLAGSKADIAQALEEWEALGMKVIAKSPLIYGPRSSYALALVYKGDSHTVERAVKRWAGRGGISL